MANGYLGKNGEAGKVPKPFGESVYFLHNFMGETLAYGIVDSEGKSTQLGFIERYKDKELANVIIAIEGEERMDARVE